MMKRFLVIFFFGLLVCGGVQAVSLDGTTTPVYKTTHHVFHDRDTTQGFVDLCKGFTVVPVASGAQSTHGANLLMDTNVTASGAIDLRGTSTLTLLRDLYLDEGVSFSDSGRIYSYGNALVMNGDLTIPADKVLHCGGNLIINGEGHTLHLGSGSQIFLDNSSTLTLRNMIIQTMHSYPGQPSLNISSSLSKLALDNVLLSLGDDLHIPRGQLFFHNDVVVTGTSALVYRSIAPSYIASHGTLMFDHGTTFSYAPASTSKDLIVLSDASSTLAFNGASLLATHTGLRLTKGRLYLDDKITLNSLAVDKLSTLSTSTWLNYGYQFCAVNTAAWSPDGRYVAVGGNQPYGGNEFQLYRCTMDTLVTITWRNYGPNDSYLYAVSWSPDGKYIAIGGSKAYGDNELQIYKFDGSVITLAASQDYGTGNATIYSIEWSPDGRYVAIGGYSPSKFGGVANTNELQIYRFDGCVLTAVTSQDYGNEIDTLSWSPDGQYLVIGGHAPTKFGSDTKHDELQIYKFTMDTLVTVTSQDYGANSNSYINSVSWSPNGNYLAVGGYHPQLFGGSNNSDALQIYQFDGCSLIAKASTGYGLYDTAICDKAVWSPDGRYLAMGGYAPVSGYGGFSNTNSLRIYLFDGSLLTPVTSQDFGYHLYALDWSPDGFYVMFGGSLVTGGTNDLQIGRCNFLNETATQALTNSIILGNGAIDSTYDLDVHVLSGARVEVTGKVYHDPA